MSARVSVLIYNPSMISAAQLPTSVLQLANPKYKGKLAFAAGETDFQPIVTSVARTYGDAEASSWLNGVKENAGSHVYPDNETIADEVNRGAVAFGVVNQYYWYRMQAELGASNVHSKIAYFAPHDPGYVVNVSGAGILKSAKNQADAQKFLAFLVSKAGPGDHRPLDQLRVPAGRRRADDGPGDAVRPAPAERDQHRRPRGRLDRDRAAAKGRPAVTAVAAGGEAPARPGPARPGRPAPRRRRRPGGLLLIAAAVAVVLLLPLAFLLVEAAGAGPGTVARLIGRSLTAQLLWNTIRLGVVVTLLCAVIGTGSAWLVERTNLPGRRVWAVLIVVPLAIPDFVVSFGWASLSTAVAGLPRRGARDDAGAVPAGLPAGGRQPPQRGPGAGGGGPQPRRGPAEDLLARHGRSGSDRHPRRLRARDHDHARRVRRVRDPRLPDVHDRDLHRVLAVVRHPGRVRAFPRPRRARPRRARRRRRTPPSRPGQPGKPHRRSGPHRGPGSARGPWPALALLAALVLLALGVPVGSAAYWWATGTSQPFTGTSLLSAAGYSAAYSGGAAALATVLALPVAILAVRHGSRVARVVERSTYLVLALPGLVIALSLSYFSERYGDGIGYQSAPMLVLAYAIMFFPLALVGLRASVAQAPVGLEDIARSLGQRRLAVFWRVTRPLVTPGLAAAFCLVFLSSVTELTATLILVPTGVQTLATQFWNYQQNLAYGQAAPFALVMIAIAAVPSYVLARFFDRLPSRAAR